MFIKEQRVTKYQTEAVPQIRSEFPDFSLEPDFFLVKQSEFVPVFSWWVWNWLSWPLKQGFFVNLCLMVFALIFTFLICLGWNFTQWSTMDYDMIQQRDQTRSEGGWTIRPKHRGSRTMALEPKLKAERGWEEGDSGKSHPDCCGCHVQNPCVYLWR